MPNLEIDELDRKRAKIEVKVNFTLGKIYKESKKAARDMPKALSEKGVAGSAYEAAFVEKRIQIVETNFENSIELCIFQLREFDCSESLTDYFYEKFEKFAGKEPGNSVQFLYDEFRLRYLSESSKIELINMSRRMKAKLKLLKSSKIEHILHKTQKQYRFLMAICIAVIAGIVIGVMALIFLL